MTETAPTVEPQTESDIPQPAITLSDAGPARKKISVEVPAEAIAAKLEENFDSLNDEAAIPGFRRGHVPKKLLDRRFGGEIRKDVCRQLVSESLEKAVEDNELRVLGEPHMEKFESMTLPESGPMTFDIEVEVVPEFELPEFEGIELRKPVMSVTDKQIEEEVVRLAEQYGQMKAVESAQGGDYLTGDVTIRGEDSESLHEVKAAQTLVPGEKRKYKGVIGGILVDDLGKRLDGAKPGQSVSIEATGPDRHENESIAGKPIVIELSVSRVERLNPLSRQELISGLGLDDEEGLIKFIRDNLERVNDNEQRRAMAEQVIETLLSKIETELPERLSARQAGSILQRRAVDLMQRGVSEEEIENQLAELRASSKEQAQIELKRLFILDAVARKLDVEVTESEVNGWVYRIAMQQGVRPERLRDQMRHTGQLDQLFVRIREEKAVGKIIEQATIKEVPAEKPGESAKPKKAKSSAKKSGAKSSADKDKASPKKKGD